MREIAMVNRRLEQKQHNFLQLTRIPCEWSNGRRDFRPIKPTTDNASRTTLWFPIVLQYPVRGRVLCSPKLAQDLSFGLTFLRMDGPVSVVAVDAEILGQSLYRLCLAIRKFQELGFWSVVSYTFFATVRRFFFETCWNELFFGMISPAIVAWIGSHFVQVCLCS